MRPLLIIRAPPTLVLLLSLPRLSSRAPLDLGIGSPVNGCVHSLPSLPPRLVALRRGIGSPGNGFVQSLKRLPPRLVKLNLGIGSPGHGRSPFPREATSTARPYHHLLSAASAPFAPGQVDTSSLVLSPLVVLEDCRGFVDSGSSLGPCMTPKVRFLDGVVCVLLSRWALSCRLHVVLHKMSNLPDLHKRCYLSHQQRDPE